MRGTKPGRSGVLATGGVGGQDVPHRLAQAQEGGVLGVAQPGLGGQQSGRAEPGGCLLPGAGLTDTFYRRESGIHTNIGQLISVS